MTFIRSSRLVLFSCLISAAQPLFAQPDAGGGPAESSPGGEPADRGDAPGALSATSDDAAGEPLPPPVDSWFETRIRIAELAEAGDYEAALALGPRLLELAEAEFGPSSAGVAEVHLLLAEVYRDQGEYLAAEEEIFDAISIYEQREGPLSVTLIDPYLALGRNYYEAGDYSSAITAYSEARTIGRRAFGLLNQEQLTIIDSMSDAAVELGDLEEANELQLEALTLVERTFGEFSEEAIEARYGYATWLREHNRFEEERQQYYQILRIAERYFEDRPLMQVRALRERANSFRIERSGDNLGLSGLRDALEIVRDMPQPNPLAHAEVLRDIGDWEVAFSRVGATGEEYLEAWRLLGQVENGDELRRRWFGELAVVSLAPLSLRGLTTDPGAPRGRVIVRFTVDPTGRTSDIEVTESDPPGFKDAAAIRQIRSSRFRPAIEDGRLTAARRALAIDFQYMPEAVDPDAANGSR